MVPIMDKATHQRRLVGDPSCSASSQLPWMAGPMA